MSTLTVVLLLTAMMAVYVGLGAFLLRRAKTEKQRGDALLIIRTGVLIYGLILILMFDVLGWLIDQYLAHPSR